MTKITLTELTFEIMEKIIAKSSLESKEQVLQEAKAYVNKLVAKQSPKEIVVAAFNAVSKIEILTLDDLKDIRRIIDL